MLRFCMHNPNSCQSMLAAQGCWPACCTTCIHDLVNDRVHAGLAFTCRRALQLTDPSTADYDKRTPLHLAAAEGCYSVVVWLLKQGAIINAVDRFKRTPLEASVLLSGLHLRRHNFRCSTDIRHENYNIPL